MSWSPGRRDIERLIDAGEIGVVTPDPVVAARLLDDADRHLRSAAAAAGLRDLSGAYQLAYDSLRKSAAALLALQGLRATSRGGHVAIQEAVRAQFDPGSPFRSFARIRRTRNALEYPDADAAEVDSDDVADAIAVARKAIDSARLLADSGSLGSWTSSR